MQRRKAAPRREIRKQRRAHHVAAAADLARQLPAEARPARIHAAREPLGEDCTADEIVPGRRKACAKSEQRARSGEHRTGIVVFERSAKRAHQWRCAIEREFRSLANEKRAKAACRPELGDILSQPAGRGDETCSLRTIWSFTRLSSEAGIRLRDAAVRTRSSTGLKAAPATTTFTDGRPSSSLCTISFRWISFRGISS